MKFYSYDYVLSQIGQQNGIMIGLGIVLLAVTGFLAFKAYHDKKGTKFRELVMISALTLLALLLVSITTYQNNQVSNNKFRALNGSEPDKYLLEKVELYKTDAIELVEVNK